MNKIIAFDWKWCIRKNLSATFGNQFTLCKIIIASVATFQSICSEHQRVGLMPRVFPAINTKIINSDSSLTQLASRNRRLLHIFTLTHYLWCKDERLIELNCEKKEEKSRKDIKPLWLQELQPLARNITERCTDRSAFCTHPPTFWNFFILCWKDAFVSSDKISLCWIFVWVVPIQKSGENWLSNLQSNRSKFSLESVRY